jgi:predicted nucleotidyltransferase
MVVNRFFRIESQLKAFLEENLKLLTPNDFGKNLIERIQDVNAKKR